MDTNKTALEKEIVAVLSKSVDGLNVHDILKAIPSSTKTQINSTLYKSKLVASTGASPPLWKVIPTKVPKEEKMSDAILFIDADNLGDICKIIDTHMRDGKWPSSIALKVFCGPAYAGALKDIASRVLLNEKDASDVDLIYNVIKTTIASPSTKIIIASRDMLLVTLANYLQTKKIVATVLRSTDDLYGIL
jgi:hypothetical protein